MKLFLAHSADHLRRFLEKHEVPMAEAVRLIAQHGSGRIQIAATHGIFSADARERLSTLPIERTFVTNTLPQTPDPRTHVLDIVPLLIAKIAWSRGQSA